MKILILQDIIDDIESSNLKDKDWYYLFANWIERMNNAKYSDNPLTLSSSFMKFIFSNKYKQIIDYFVEKQWMTYSISPTGNKSYLAGDKCTEYYLNLPPSITASVNIKNKSVKKKLVDLFNHSLNIKYSKNKYNELDLKYQRIEERYKKILDEKLTVDIPEDLLENIEKAKSIYKYHKNNLPDWTTGRKTNGYARLKKLINESNKELIKYTNEYNKLNDLQKINEYKQFSIDSYGFRVHTSITRLNKVYRKNIKINMNEIFEIDLVNAQPWLLSNLFKNDELFINDCSKGLFYEMLIDPTIICPVLRDVERGQIKLAMYYILFGAYQKNTHILNIALKDPKSVLNRFISRYPKVWEFVELYNTLDFHNLSKTLQRMESELVVYSVWNELDTLNKYCITIHDSIIVEIHNKEIAIDTFIKHIKLINYSMPNFNFKIY